MLLLCSRNVWRQIFFPAAERDHEAHSAVFGDCTDPIFLMNIAPSGKPLHGTGFDISLCREEKKLHALLGYPDLGDASRLIVVENTATDCAKIGELCRDVIMFQTVFHKKQIAQRSRIRIHGIEHDRPRGASDCQ